MSWDKLGEFALKVLRDEMAKPQTRYDAMGRRKPIRYPLNNTGNFSRSLDYEVKEYGDGEVDIFITYPDQAPFKYQAPIFFETGRQPGKGVPPLALKQWAKRKVRGFNNLSESKQNSFLYFTQLKIKKRGIGSLQIFSNLNQLIGERFEEFMNTLTEDELANLPQLDEINEVLDRLSLIDNVSIQEL